MHAETHSKVQAQHLKRKAYLYVRQSTLRQVFENTESTKRQYDLRNRAIALGWSIEQIVVIDSDLGQSGASAVDREGFQKLVSEVGLGHAGIVMGLEVSRLARNSTDWHRLLEICALADTLILDEDGVYDPSHFNDRLLLGMKGTMSEAELHILRARLRGGILNKARRGELEIRLPIGYVYDLAKKISLDPDTRIQDIVRFLFKTFQRTGSATATVKVFRSQGLEFPRRVYAGPMKGQVVWGELDHSRVLWAVRHPCYAGAYSFGRTSERKSPMGPKRYKRVPREEWTSLILNAHEGYLTWEEYEQNLKRLRDNATLYGSDRSAPREGPALLQGLAICGRCGERMTIRYNVRRGKAVPTYLCQRQGIQKGGPVCQCIPGQSLDEAIGQLLIDQVTPMTLEVALDIQREAEARAGECDHLYRQEVEQAQYHSDLARRRYMQVDPDNRLVADSLEAAWNEALKHHLQAQDRYEKRVQEQQAGLSESQRQAVVRLAEDFPRLWNDPQTSDRDRKRMARLLIADVTLLREGDIVAEVRFNGGLTQTRRIPLPLSAGLARKTSSEAIEAIAALTHAHTDEEIAQILNERGLRSGEGLSFDKRIVSRCRRDYKIPGIAQRLREGGMLTTTELAKHLGVPRNTISKWREEGLLKAFKCDEHGHTYLFERPEEDVLKSLPHQGIHDRLAAARQAATQHSQ